MFRDNFLIRDQSKLVVKILVINVSGQIIITTILVTNLETNCKFLKLF